MNYLEFVDSLTVREHLRAIGYKPDSLSLAYIVWQSSSKTLDEKAEAFEEIIKNTEDMPIHECEYYSEEPSLHAFLRRYCDTLNEKINAFLKKDEGGVFDYSIYYAAPDNDWAHDRKLFSDFEKARAAVISELLDDRALSDDGEGSSKLVRIRKRLLDSEDEGESLFLTPSLEFYEYDPSATKISSEEYDTLTRFMGVCLPIPHPFKSGDTVRECAGIYALPPYYHDTLTVTDFYSEEYIKENRYNLGMHDYVLFGKSEDEEGVIYDARLDHYLSVEKT